MTLLDVETVLLYPVSTDIITDKCLDILMKVVTSGGKWLKSHYIGYE